MSDELEALLRANGYDDIADNLDELLEANIQRGFFEVVNGEDGEETTDAAQLRTKFYYLATPYMDADSVVRQRRFEQAKLAAEAAIRRGLVAWSPIASSHPMALNGIEPPQGWYQWDLNLLEAINPDRLVIAVVKLPGWDKSHGVRLEIQWAEHHGVPVEYWEPENGD